MNDVEIFEELNIGKPELMLEKIGLQRRYG